MSLNKNIIVVVTKLQKKKKTDIFTEWGKCDDFINVKTAVHTNFNDSISVLPLKFSSVFDTIFEQEKSIAQLMEQS